MQARLLRVLQERVYEPLGSVEPVETDVRVIAATNRDLTKLVRKGTFRQDLFYRINVIRLKLPALCDRREDIPLLVERFISRFNRLQGKDVAAVSEETLAILMEHDYPGNVRELENIIEHAFVLCRGGLIEPEQLPAAFRGDGDSMPAQRTHPRTLKALEALHIADAVRRHGGNRTAAAKELGINPSTLFRKIKSLEIRLPESSQPRAEER